MIRELLNRKNTPAVTSDHWHVVVARLSGEPSGKPSKSPRFERSIVSEHDDRASAVTAAREIVSTFVVEMAGRERSARDQVFVRKPKFKSLKTARRVSKRRK
jgi:hypothetical protein